MATFVRNYFPVFMLGALFGKMIEISGFAKALAAGISHVAGRTRAMLGIVVICALMVYGGVSVFVVGFAVYPFAAELFREAAHPQAPDSRDDVARLVHVRDGRAAGQPADPEHHPDDVLRDDDDGGADSRADRRRVHLRSSAWRISNGAGARRRRRAKATAPGISTSPRRSDAHALVSPFLAFAAARRRRRREHRASRCMIPKWYGATATLALTPAARPIAIEVSRQVGVWAVEAALRARHPDRRDRSPGGG